MTIPTIVDTANAALATAQANLAQAQADEINNKVDPAPSAADLEKKTYENEKLKQELERARQDADAARAKDVTERLRASVPAFSQMSGSSVAFPEKQVFREAEIARVALNQAARSTAVEISAAVKALNAKRPSVLLTDNPALLQIGLSYTEFTYQLKALLAVGTAALTEPIPDGPTPIPPSTPAPPGPTPLESGLSVFDVATTTSQVAASALTELVSLFSVESSITSASRTATALETHIPIMAALIREGVTVLHDSIAMPPNSSPLLTDVETVVQLIQNLNVKRDEIDARVAQLGDDDSVAPLVNLLKTVRAKVEGVTTRIAGVVDRSFIPSANGLSPLAAALLAERMLGRSANSTEPTAIVVVPAAAIRSDQVAVKRRLLRPRSVATSFAEVHFVVLDRASGSIRRVGTTTGSSAYAVKFAVQPEWTSLSASSFMAAIGAEGGADVGAVALPPPGWYPDAQGVNAYWDGAQWAASPEAPAATSVPAGGTGR